MSRAAALALLRDGVLLAPGGPPRHRLDEKGVVSDPGSFPIKPKYLRRLTQVFKLREVTRWGGHRSTGKAYLTAQLEAARAHVDLQQPSGDSAYDPRGRVLQRNSTGIDSAVRLITVSPGMTPRGAAKATNADRVALMQPRRSTAQVLRTLAREFYSVHDFNAGYALPKDTSLGPIHFETDDEIKEAQIGNIEPIVDLLIQLVVAIVNNDPDLADIALTRLAFEFDVVIAHKDGTRHQTDKASGTIDKPVPKPREVYDWRGVHFQEVIKLVVILGRAWLRSRVRLVYNASFIINAIVNLLFSMWRKPSMQLLAHTVKTLDAREIEELVSICPFRATGDAAEADHSLAWWMGRACQHGWQDAGVPPLIGWLGLFQLHAPVFQNNDHEGGRGMLAIGLPARLAGFIVQTGNPSGVGQNGNYNHVCVSGDAGEKIAYKIGELRGHPEWMHDTEFVLDIVRAISERTPNGIPRIERMGKAKVLNRGDNEDVYASEAKLLDLLVSALSRTGGTDEYRPLYRVEFDKAPILEGYEQQVDLQSGEIHRFAHYGKIAEKIWNAEEADESKTAPMAGQRERRQRIFSLPNGDDLWRANRVGLNMLQGGDIDSFIDREADGEENRYTKYGPLTAKDREVIEDHSKLSWKYDESEINKLLVRDILGLITEARAREVREYVMKADCPALPEPEWL